MPDRVLASRALPFAHLLGLGKRPKAAPKPAKTPRASAPTSKPKGAPRIRASDYSHLFVAPAEAPPAISASTRSSQPSAPSGPQTSPKALSAEAEKALAARIIAAGRRRRGES